MHLTRKKIFKFRLSIAIKVVVIICVIYGGFANLFRTRMFSLLILLLFLLIVLLEGG